MKPGVDSQLLDPSISPVLLSTGKKRVTKSVLKEIVCSSASAGKVQGKSPEGTCLVTKKFLSDHILGVH